MMIREVKNGVVYYRSTLLKSSHAFSTRFGGVSTPSHLASMNLGRGRGDDEAALEENYRIFLRQTSLPTALCSAEQIHSDRIVTVDQSYDFGAPPPQCDGFVTKQTGITLAVKIADCLPILLEDPDAGVIGAVHAGWRGSVKGIVLQALGEMEKLGADVSRIRAVIGPRIGACCFEVKQDFIEEYRKMMASDRFLVSRQGKTYCDLPMLNRELLLGKGS